MRVVLSWSSGKDSAWALHLLRQQLGTEIVSLLSTFNEAFDRVTMHGVRRELVEAQAHAAGLPLWPVFLPWPCPNNIYERRMREVLREASARGITHVAFGDLYLEDVRDYRVRLLAGSGLEPLFPLWSTADRTTTLAREMLAAGLQAVLTCVDPKQISADFAGRAFDQRLLDDLPPSADPCGEHGEFHTFCHAGPMFQHDIPIRTGDIVNRDGFCFADVNLV